MWKLIHNVLYFISLVIMGNNTEFERAVLWLSENLTFDVDARINLFEVNISTGLKFLSPEFCVTRCGMILEIFVF